jgi:hypothetical protein
MEKAEKNCQLKLVNFRRRESSTCLQLAEWQEGFILAGL